MNYALIENNIVTNCIWLLPNNATDFPNAVPCHDYQVFVGDTYADGVFYRDGERVLTYDEIWQREFTDVQETLDIILGGVTE